jgi:methyl halide transferase
LAWWESCFLFNPSSPPASANQLDWEQRYETGDTPWEKGAPAPPLLEWLESRGSIRGDILVPGCGSGHDVRAIAAASPGAKVIGLDIAPSALDRARRFSLAGNETYQWADLFDLPIGLTNRFDWVFEHTCFCALEPARRVDYVRAITRALKPKGALLAIFFLNPWDPGEMPEEGGPPFEVTREELDLLFGTRFELVEELKPRRAYPEREGREIIRLLRRNDSDSVGKESAHGSSE